MLHKGFSKRSLQFLISESTCSLFQGLCGKGSTIGVAAFAPFVCLPYFTVTGSIVIPGLAKREREKRKK